MVNRAKLTLLSLFIVFFCVFEYSLAASFIEDIVLFTDSAESGIFQSISQYGAELERNFKPGFNLGLQVQGQELTKPEIKKFSHHISIIYKNSKVRGKDFLLPVFLCPVKSIRVCEKGFNSEILIELSHSARLVRTDIQEAHKSLFKIKDVGKELADIPRPEIKSFTLKKEILKNELIKNREIVKNKEPLKKINKIKILERQVNSLNENNGISKSVSKIEPRLKDIDVVTDKPGSVEVRFKFSKMPKYRKIELKEKVVLVFSNIETDLKSKRIPVNKGGLRVIDLSIGKDAVRVVMLLDEKYKVDLLKSQRRLRAFIVEQDKEFEVISDKVKNTQPTPIRTPESIVKKIKKIIKQPIKQPIKKNIKKSIDSIELKEMLHENILVINCTGEPEFIAEINESSLILEFKDTVNKLKASAMIFNKKYVKTIRSFKKGSACEIKVEFSKKVNLKIGRAKDSLNIVYKTAVENKSAIVKALPVKALPVKALPVKALPVKVAPIKLTPNKSQNLLDKDNKDSVKNRRALIKRLSDLIKNRDTKKSSSKELTRPKAVVKVIKNPGLSKMKKNVLKTDETAKSIDETAKPIEPKDIIIAHTLEKVFIGVPLEKDFTWKKTQTDKQIILKIKGPEWKLPWTKKKLDSPLKFIRVIKRKQGFMMLIVLDDKACESAEVKMIEKGFNITIIKKKASIVSESREEAFKKTVKRISEKQDKIINISDFRKDTGMDKSLVVDKRVEIIKTGFNEEKIEKENLRDNKNLRDDKNGVLIPPKMFAPENKQARKNRLNKSSDQPSMNKLSVFDILGGKRVVMTMDRPVKPRVIKTQNQIILDFENVFFADKENVRMVFEDPLKILRANISTKGLKVIAVLSKPATSTINYDKSRIIMDLLEISEKRENKLKQLTTLGRKRINRKKMLNIKRRQNQLKAIQTGVPVPVSQIASEDLRTELNRSVDSFKTNKNSMDSKLETVGEKSVKKLKSLVFDDNNPIESVLTEVQVDSKPFGADEKLFEYADANTIKSALKESQRKGSAYEFYIQGMASAERGNWIEAYDSYKKSLELVPYDVNVIRALNIATPKKEALIMFKKGNEFAEIDQWDKAAWAYNEALKKDGVNPKYSFAAEKARNIAAVMNVFEEGKGFYKAGYYSKAIDYLKKVTQARPAWANGYIFLGRAYDGQKWHKAAVMTYQRALEIEPGNGEILGLMDLSRKRLRVQDLYGAGKSLEKKGEYLKASAKYKTALALEGEYRKIASSAGTDYMAEAKKLFNLGRLEETVKLTDKAIKVDPDNEDAHYWKGRALMGLSRIADAVLEFKKVTELDPKSNVGLDELMTQ